MAKPILLITVPANKIDHLSTYDEFRRRVSEICSDYNVLTIIDGVKVEIITERNQNQSLAV